MSEHHTDASASDGQSASMVTQAQEKVQETAQQASGAAAKAVRDQVETRAGQASAELQSVAAAMRRSGHSLHADGNEASAKIVDGVTEKMESLGSYLGSTNGDRMLHDVEAFGRRRPWAMIGVGAALGFAASRFLKASSRNRYESAVQAGRPAAAPGAGIPTPTPVYPSTPPVAAPQSVGAAPVSRR